MWVELQYKFGDGHGHGYGYQQVIFVGDYKNGKKVGIWKEMIRDQKKMEGGLKKIKEIQYDQ